MERMERQLEQLTVRLEELVEYVQRGKSPKYTEFSHLPVINQKCVRWSGLDKSFVRFIHEDQKSAWEASRYLEVGDLLWNSTGAGTIGRACLYKGELKRAVVDSHVTIVRTRRSILDPIYLYFFIMSSKVQDGIEKMQSGSTNQVELSKAAILDLQVPLRPLNEQRRIVEKIETLFSQLDAGEAALRQVQTLLARYRQSVLKAAVTGALTADWRAQNTHRLEHGRDLLARILQTRRDNWQGRGKYQEPAAPDTSDLPELPERWVWATVAQLAAVMGGLTKNSKREIFPLRRPMLRVANVYQNRLDLTEVHEIGLSEAELPRVSLVRGDILVVEGNGSKDQIGRMAVWSNEIPDAIHQNHLIKIRMLESQLTDIALVWFQSPYGRQNIEKVASSTSGLHTLSISKVGALVVPVPPIEEIAEINQMVNEAFDCVENLEAAVRSELTRSAALRQSILKDAFSGKLVPQDPSDEPAAALLARIRAERAAPEAPKRRGRAVQVEKTKARKL